MNNNEASIVDLFIEEENRIRFGVIPDREKSYMNTFMQIQQQNVNVAKATPEAYQEMFGALVKGVTQGTLGFPADLIGLATGVMNMLTDDPEDKGNLQQFAEGYGTVPFTSERISEYLESLGWKYEGVAEGAELAGEFVAPGSVGTTAVEKGVSKTKNLKTKPITVTGQDQ